MPAVVSASIPADPKLNKVDRELQFLELRRQLKAPIRDQIKKETASLFSSSQEKKKLPKPNDNYGSFFGRSKPCIAARVLQESKLMTDIQQLAARHLNSASSKAVVPISKMKAQELRAARDYSFIFSDNEENLTLSSATSAKAVQMPSQLKSPKCKASDDQRLSLQLKLSKSQFEQKDELLDDQPMKVNLVMPTKLRLAPSLHKGLVGTKSRPISKKQVGRGKEFRRLKETLLPPQSQGKSLPRHEDKRPIHQPVYSDEHDQSYDISSLCQTLFRRNHNKRGRDYDNNYDDDDCMVASFDDIQKEEKKSEKIARKEDRLEQLRIEQEERRKAKRQKLLEN